MPGMSHDYRELMWDESADLVAFLDELDDDEFDRMSLCDGWRVRDVMSHMLYGHTTPAVQLLPKVVRYRGNVPRASFELSKGYGTSHTPAQIRAGWGEVARRRTRVGIARTISYKEGFTDHLVHHQDMRRPLGRPRAIPADRLRAALDAVPTLAGMVKSKQRMAGLRFQATDLDWAHGEGLLVQGPGEAIVLAATGRRVALADLSGEGLPLFTARLASI
jgi:uncharacterized protein (TIGR03083 family)